MEDVEIDCKNIEPSLVERLINTSVQNENVNEFCRNFFVMLVLNFRKI